MVVGEGFEPSKLAQQIYSLPPLTAREPHQRRKGNPNQASPACQAFLAQLQKISSEIAAPGAAAPNEASVEPPALFFLFFGGDFARDPKNRVLSGPRLAPRLATGSVFKTEPPASTPPVFIFGNARRLNARGATERKGPGAGLAPKWRAARPGCGCAAPRRPNSPA